MTRGELVMLRQSVVTRNDGYRGGCMKGQSWPDHDFDGDQRKPAATIDVGAVTRGDDWLERETVSRHLRRYPKKISIPLPQVSADHRHHRGITVISA